MRNIKAGGFDKLSVLLHNLRWNPFFVYPHGSNPT